MHDSGQLRVFRHIRAGYRLMMLALLAILSPTVHADFHVLPGEVQDSIHVIAVLPTAVPLDLQDGDAVAAMVDAELATALSKAGFKVIGVDTYQSIETEYRGIIGGWFDPVTGEVKEPIRQAIVSKAIEAVLERNEADGFIRIDLVRQRVDFKDAKKVAWDGVFEDAIAKQGLLASINQGLGKQNAGYMAAASLSARIYNSRGQVIFESAGGIAALAALANGSLVSVDNQAVLHDAGRLQRAVGVLTWPLTNKGTAEPVRQFSGTAQDKPSSHSTLPLAEAETLPASLPAAQIKQQVMTIALAPIVPTDHPQAAMVKARYEKLLTDGLTKRGFRVLPPDTFMSVVKATASEVGGIYDPITGKKVEEKAKAARQALAKRLREEQAVDAILTPDFKLVGAPYAISGDAKWDGVTQSVLATPAGWNGKAYTGVQPAISLTVKLEDMTEQHLYSRRGGIELASQFIGGDFQRRPMEQLLIDETKAAHAVDLALAGMSSE